MDAVAVNANLAKLDVEIAEAQLSARPREILSHTLVLSTQQTGRAVLKQHDRVSQIELRARIERLLGQERLRLPSHHVAGAALPDPVGMKVDVEPEEGSDGTQRRIARNS